MKARRGRHDAWQILVCVHDFPSAPFAGFLHHTCSWAGGWLKTIGGHGFEQATSVQHTRDGGYILAGCVRSVGAGGSDMWVVKLDASGNVVWQKGYGGPADECAQSIQERRGGGYIVAGNVTAPGGLDQDLWLLRLDSTGKILWQKTYGGSRWDEVHSVRQTADGGYALAGYTESFNAAGHDLWLLKLNPSGSIAWQKLYGGVGDDEAQSVQQTRDGGYIVAGLTDSYGAGHQNVWLLKLNAAGNVRWQRTYGGPEFERATSVLQTDDGGYMVAASIGTYDRGADGVWLLRLNAEGNIGWQKAYQRTNVDDPVLEQTRDDGYLIAGTTRVRTESNHVYHVWLLRLDSAGNAVWQRVYGGIHSDVAKSVLPTWDGGCLVAGYTSSFGRGNLLLLKLDEQGLGLADGCALSIRNTNVVAERREAGVGTSSTYVSNTDAVPQSTNTVVTETEASAASRCQGQ
jgi:hypothetical protein